MKCASFILSLVVHKSLLGYSVYFQLWYDVDTYQKYTGGQKVYLPVDLNKVSFTLEAKSTVQSVFPTKASLYCHIISSPAIYSWLAISC